MGRKYCILFFTLLTVTLRLSAQSNLEFVENKGQWDAKVKYMGNLGRNGSFYLEKKGFTVVLHDSNDIKRLFDNHQKSSKIHRPDRTPNRITVNDNPDSVILHSHAYNMVFEGASENAEVVPDKPLPTYNNYFLGKDPSKWVSNAKIYQGITYKNVYPKIDVRYYTEAGNVKYDLIVHPGGDVSKIIMKYAGINKMSIRNGELVLQTSVGDVRELYPYSYQVLAKGKTPVDASYQLAGDNRVKLSVKNYDKSAVLVIDPTLIFCSFTGSAADQYGFTATPAPDGGLFSGGIVFSSGFPVSPGAYQANYIPGGSKKVDMGIFKFNSTGTSRLYATYLGGNMDDYPHSLISDGNGNLVILGRSYSLDFPGIVVGNGGGGDIVVTKLNSTGTALIGSMRIGGTGKDGINIEDIQESGSHGVNSILRNYGDDSRSEVILDAANNIYIAAQTQSGSDFPIRPNAGSVFQGSFGGGTQDAVVIKINPNVSSVIFSSFLGGNGNDGAFGIKLHPPTGNIYVVGATSSSNFQTTPGVLQPGYQGGVCDGFVTVVTNNGTTRLQSTFLGTGDVDVIYALQFDNLGFPYIMGISKGSWPVLNVAYSNSGAKQFISKLRPDLSAYVYSTTFGTSSSTPNISPVAFLVDRCENVYASGWGGWLGDAGTDPFELAGTFGMPTTPDAIKSVTDNKDFYFIVLKKDAASLLYGSFFGQQGGYGEHVDGGTSRFDQQGAIYQAICANCLSISSKPQSPFPTTPGVWGPVNPAGDGCNLAAVKIAFNFAGVGAGPKTFINSVGRNVGCIPLTVEFRDTLLLAKTFEWDFDGDGVTDQITNTPSTTFTYNAVGTYRVRLIGVDSTTCNIRDTSYTNVIARADRAPLDFTYVKVGPCESLEFQFTNTAIAPPAKPFTVQSFMWDFDDNTPRVISGPLPINHTFATPGTYDVKLILIDTNYCNAPDTVTKELRIAPLVKAQFETPPTGCAPYDAIFKNTSIAGREFFWDFGDGTTSTEVDPIHLYASTGTYTIRLRVVDTSTCNKTDSTSFTITVNPKPQAAFTHLPIPAEENKPTVFFNGSIGATRFRWFFGDGDSTFKNNMDTVMHQYNSTGVFQACLVAINQFGCTDTACTPVEAIITPVLDVPNAFTPGRPGSRGKNHIVKPEGFGLGKVMFRIYNRWGQKLFETTNPKQGWDGTFKGVLQPMDVYVYTLEVEFTDGTRASKKGDITLIR